MKENNGRLEIENKALSENVAQLQLQAQQVADSRLQQLLQETQLRIGLERQLAELRRQLPVAQGERCPWLQACSALGCMSLLCEQCKRSLL